MHKRAKDTTAGRPAFSEVRTRPHAPDHQIVMETHKRPEAIQNLGHVACVYSI